MLKKMKTALMVACSAVALQACAQTNGMLGATQAPADTVAVIDADANEVKSIDTSYLDELELNFEQFTLDNGLTVFVVPDHSVPKVYLEVIYRVGSKDEPEGKTGFAHLFEHLMFQKTANRDVDYINALQEIGVTGLNGTTSNDRTNYYQTVPSAALDDLLWLQSDRMLYLMGGMDQAALEEQRGVVINEKKQGELDPRRLIGQKSNHEFYPIGHPYRHPVIGSLEDIEGATLEDVGAWFDKYYGASNTIAVLAGDVDVETAREKMQQYFGALPTGKPVETVEQWIPTQEATKKVVTYQKVGAPSLTRTWALPDSSSPDTVIMGLAGGTLAGPRTAPLTRRLVHEEQLATNVSANGYGLLINGAFSISVSLKPGADAERVSEIIDEELERFFEEGPDPQRLANFRLSQTESFVRGLESAPSLGQQLAMNYYHHGDPLRLVDHARLRAEATPRQIADLARKYLTQPYMEMHVMPELKGTTTVDVDRSARPEHDEFVGDVQFPPISEATLSNGLKVVVAERHNIPVVDISMSFDTGSLIEDQYARDVASNAFGLMTAGTKNYTADELSEAFARVNMGVRSGAGERTSGASWGGLKSQIDEGTALAAEVLRNPVYPQEEIDKIISRIDASFDGYEAAPTNAAGPAFGRALWGEEHRRGQIATRETAKQISRDMILDFHANEVGPNIATVFMIGDITLEEGVALIERHFGDWEQIEPTPMPDNDPAMGEPGRVILIDAPESPQSSITVGHIVGPYDPANSELETLMTAAIGQGFTSRINLNLREDKGWAYGARAGTSRSPVGQRTFSARATVQSDKTAEAMVEFRKEITDYVTTRPITQREFDRDQKARVRSYPAGFDNGGAFLSRMQSAATYGLPYNHAEKGASRLEAVTREQAEAYAKEIIDPSELTWVVVGDLSLIEEDVRALGYGDVEVWDVYGNKLR